MSHGFIRGCGKRDTLSSYHHLLSCIAQLTDFNEDNINLTLIPAGIGMVMRVVVIIGAFTDMLVKRRQAMGVS